MACLRLSEYDLVADLTCGMGNFFNHAPVETNVYGCELDLNAYKVARYLYPQANLVHGDIRAYQLGVRFDYVVGNGSVLFRLNAKSSDFILIFEDFRHKCAA